MSLLICKYYLNKENEKENGKKLFFIRQKIKARAIELIEGIEKNEIDINKEILWLKFFNKLLEYLNEIYLYRKIMETNTDKKYIIKIEKAKKKLENLFKP